jgi:hypothetical protein
MINNTNQKLLKLLALFLIFVFVTSAAYSVTRIYRDSTAVPYTVYKPSLRPTIEEIMTPQTVSSVSTSNSMSIPTGEDELKQFIVDQTLADYVQDYKNSQSSSSASVNQADLIRSGIRIKIKK